ncbi:hypothetical protein Mmc1_1153 [Magnetococcus marinus MC-1]|uniref:Uncharacterized protein n=1 Tax=Magnetococcus marinus (strain ATCC BAA-1437 / JCM 17883 / MC-1) TaxID=156889 RepID=A0L6S1_MAGMM|nr:hypothetical protein [Magnetococcus marinus]ABK43664.1 hypothetical protein Mmc1_1153 [Magnetococcus marinus MC-1]
MFKQPKTARMPSRLSALSLCGLVLLLSGCQGDGLNSMAGWSPAPVYDYPMQGYQNSAPGAYAPYAGGSYGQPVMAVDAYGQPVMAVDAYGQPVMAVDAYGQPVMAVPQAQPMGAYGQPMGASPYGQPMMEPQYSQPGVMPGYLQPVMPGYAQPGASLDNGLPSVAYNQPLSSFLTKQMFAQPQPVVAYGTPQQQSALSGVPVYTQTAQVQPSASLMPSPMSTMVNQLYPQVGRSTAVPVTRAAPAMAPQPQAALDRLSTNPSVAQPASPVATSGLPPQAQTERTELAFPTPATMDKILQPERLNPSGQTAVPSRSNPFYEPLPAAVMEPRASNHTLDDPLDPVVVSRLQAAALPSVR